MRWVFQAGDCGKGEPVDGFQHGKRIETKAMLK
jgi:hypothetical protein